MRMFKPTLHKTWIVTLVAAIALVLLWWTTGSTPVKTKLYNEKIAAAERMKNAEEILKKYHLFYGEEIDVMNDPMQIGLIGPKESAIIKDFGRLEDKKALLDPNLAAVFVQMLFDAGVQSGETVAVAVSGSLPGANLALYAALEELNISAVIISSLISSMWGAGYPDFTWLDMEQVCFREEIFKNRSVAATLGGGSDKGKGITKKGRKQLRTAAKRSKIMLIEEKTLSGNITKRLEKFEEFSPLQDYPLFINIGSGAASTGDDPLKLENGITKKIPIERITKQKIKGVIARFSESGVPIVNLMLPKAKRLESFGKYEFDTETAFKIGEGNIYRRYDTKKAWISLILLSGIIAYLGYNGRRKLELAIVEGHRIRKDDEK
ncbi:MAG: poly-gamma-glutamate system protein [Candidatus Marinimicrobia bacterium]|nr:poly-gamma-glutamate system protein [Candidatus Neomarinimicrobiota bacterium]